MQFRSKIQVNLQGIRFWDAKKWTAVKKYRTKNNPIIDQSKKFIDKSGQVN